MSEIGMLSKIAFTKDLSETVMDFHCGKEGKEETDWERDVSNYIKSDDSFHYMSTYQTKTFLYYDVELRQVGYGSIGTTRWPDKELPKGRPRRRINLIPYVGLRSNFRGKPDGPREQHYSTLILRDLENEATMVHDWKGEEVLPLLGLFVDPRNTSAIALYKWYGFRNYPYHTPGLDPEHPNQAMIFKLNRPAK